MSFWVYILASRKHGTLYVGMTNDLGARIAQHRAATMPAFTRTYGVFRLVYAETHGPAMKRCSARRASSAGRAPGRSS